MKTEEETKDVQPTDAVDAAPKKKNLKHLRLLPEKAESIAAKLAEGKQVFDTEIYSALKNYNNPKPAESGEI